MSMNKDQSSAWLFRKDHVENWAWVNNVFTPEECQKIISYAKSTGTLSKGVVFNETLQSKGIRKSNIRFLQPQEEIEWVYRKLTDIILGANEQFFKFDLYGLTEGLQFTEYVAPDGNYKYHIDKAYNDVIRKLSFSIQLTDPSSYDNGDFEILLDEGQNIKTVREQGAMVLFPSYVLHRVSPITKGTRHSLVGWISGPCFK